MELYFISSVELNLFFLRIMKEHAIFLEASFPQINEIYSKAADQFKDHFEKILEEYIQIGKGAVRPNVLESCELVTPYTLKAEEITKRLTGIEINMSITQSEKELSSGCSVDQKQVSAANLLNQKTLRLLDNFIEFKEGILKEVTACRMYTSNYPLLIQHIIREAKLYRSYLTQLQTKGSLHPGSMKKQEQFWNQIMMEHALFIRGLLDPTENELIGKANSFAGEYARLLTESREKVERNALSSTYYEYAKSDMGYKNDCAMNELTAKTKEVTCRYRDFKEAGTKGISNCEITSVILPLLADHVLREANHYLRLLDE